MKPASFDLFQPQDWSETLNALKNYDKDAMILAGGQSLIAMMNMRIAKPKVLIDINTIKDDEMLITADTIVCNSDSVLNKPKNYNESIEMLTSLSGKTHKVISSVYVYTHKKQIIFSDETEVTFLDLDPDIITYYIEKYQPFDKAGSYGIQEWIGLVGIDNINGSFTNVVGLPSSKLFQTIRNF